LSADRPQAVVPAGIWQAAEPEEEAVLCGCTVAPGFDFADFELGEAGALIAAFPDAAALIRRLSR
jgi:predicted cupin superfamily sugar epimerase